MIDKLASIRDIGQKEGVRYILNKSYNKMRKSLQSWSYVNRIYIDRQEKLSEAGNNIITVSPNQIQYCTIHDMDPRYVYGGRWDKAVISFNSLDRVQGIKDHFVNDRPWSETRYYRKMMRNYVNENRSWRGIRTEEDLLDFFGRVDDLYENIRKNGYKSQEQLQRDTENYQRQVSVQNGDKGDSSRLINEIGVSIGRNGEILHQNQGRHRLSISQVLDISRIPVYVIGRHKKWQKVRNIVLTSNSVEDIPTKYRKYFDHPDILNFIRGQEHQ